MRNRILPTLLIALINLCLLSSYAAQEDDSNQPLFVGPDDPTTPAPGTAEDRSAGVPPAKEDSPKEPAEVVSPASEPNKEDPPKEPAPAAPPAPEPNKEDSPQETPAAVPPAPEPTAEQLQQRSQKSLEYRSLAEKAFDFPVTGSLTTRYRARFDGQGDHDQDMYSYLSIDVGDKNRQWATGHADVRFSEDINNSRTGLQSDIFAGVLDTYHSNLDMRLYSCYVDFNKITGVEYLRVGRQWNYDTPEVLQFDGARLNTAPVCGLHEVQFSFYGGVPVHLDESSSHSDWLVGAAAEGKPWESARLRLDYTHLNDDLSNYDVTTQDLVGQSLNPAPGTAKDNLFALSMWQTFKNPNINLFGRMEMLDGEAREATARMTYYKPEWQLQIATIYDVWFKRQNHLATELDPFTATLDGQEPYQDGSLVVSKEWAEHYRIEGGAMVRRFLPGAQNEEFNHEFDRYYMTFGVHDLPVKGLSASATGYWYEGKDGAPSIGTAGGEISYAWNKNLRSTAGTSYDLYKYDLFQATENDSVRTYYFKQRWRPKRWAALDFDYEYERSLSRDFHTVMLTFRFNF